MVFTVPFRRVGNLWIMFANPRIYSMHPYLQEAALDAVARHWTVDEYRKHRRFNIGSIQ